MGYCYERLFRENWAPLFHFYLNKTLKTHLSGVMVWISWVKYNTGQILTCTEMCRSSVSTLKFLQGFGTVSIEKCHWAPIDLKRYRSKPRSLLNQNMGLVTLVAHPPAAQSWGLYLAAWDNSRGTDWLCRLSGLVILSWHQFNAWRILLWLLKDASRVLKAIDG